MHFDWSVLCGRGDNLTIWEHGDFGHCFEQLVFVCGSHFLLAVCSAFHFSRHQHRRLRGPIPRCITLHIRFIVCLLIGAVPLILLFLIKLLHPSPIDIITWCVKVAAWLMHSSFVWRLFRLYHIHIRGPVVVVLSYLCTVASDVVHLRTAILHIHHKSSFFTTAEEYVIIIVTFFHLLYVLTLIPSQRPTVSSGIAGASVINSSSSQETSRLLDNDRRATYESSEHPVISQQAEDSASCFAKVTFSWVNSLMQKGSQLNSSSDLLDLPKKLHTNVIESEFSCTLSHDASHPRHQMSVDYANNDGAQTSQHSEVEVLQPTRQPCLNKMKQQSLLSALNKTYGREYYCLGVLKFLSDAMNFAGPMLLNLLVSYMENAKEATWHGYLYAAGLFLSTLLGSLLSTQFNYHVSVIGLKIRAAIITSIYRKTLAVNTVTLSRFSAGEVVNFMSTDTDRIVNFCPSFHQFWSLPVQVGVALYLLYQQVGLSFLTGLGFVLLLIPINRWIANKIGELSKYMMEYKDSRIKLMSEILAGIRVIKYFTWENEFSKRIGIHRHGELQNLKGRKYLDALCVFFWATTPVLISILTFMTYVLLGHDLTAAKVFTSMALFNILIMPLNAFPWVINGLMEAWISLKRVECFVKLPNLVLADYYSHHKAGVRGEGVIEIKSGYFSWKHDNDDDDDDCGDDDEDDKRAPSTDDKAWPEEDKCNFDETLSEAHTLENIDLKVNQGELVGVIGKVGSGKSSLISAILAEMHKVQGHINVMNVEVGFGVTRGEAWLQNATVRDNILFGKPMNSKKYDQIISACALTEDFEALPSGDLTEVGERGVTLSGGQKARLTLARAVYQDKDIYLLDDPLSAVDAHVAKHLYENCIMGCLKRKTRVLCTHHTQYLQQADKIIVMANGKIVQSGSPDVVLSGMDSIMTSYQLDEVSRASPTASFSGSGDAESHSEKHPSGAEGGLVQEEEKDSGIVKLHVYQAFWNAVGRCLAPLVLLSLFLMQASRNISDWWLSYWVTQDSKNSSHFHPNNLTMRLEHNASDVKFYLTVYGSIAGANTVFVLARSFLFAYGGVCAATKVHIDLLGSVLKAPIWFFDKTPLGRIMNRFSTDVYCIDDSLPFMLNILLAQLYGLAGTLVICCYGLPWFALLLVPLGILYYFIQRHYRETSREIKRITSVTLSPIYAHFAETVDGLAIIQASRETSRFANENCEKLEENQKSQYANNAVSQWLAVRLQMIGVAMVTGVAFIAVLEHHFQSVNPGLVGLALSYALSVTGLLSGVVTYFTETEKQMVSMERARQYIDTMPAERQWSILNAPPYWPIQGAVAFNHVCLRYRDGLPLALDNVTFETQPAEKIGIVGRTGSGKSSLFCTLFCMAGLESGTIMIDGINIGHLPLQELRSRLSIIPQDPFLFTGSVGENLDPSLTYTAREMWDVLKKCHLAEAVRRLGGLEAEVGEKGRLFSAGERQLLCLARSMLTSAKVLCIDEATASVDHHTDSLLQQSIRTEFRDHTVFTIAHRMQTVLDSDRVIVMNQGKIVEFDTPSKLLQSKKIPCCIRLLEIKSGYFSWKHDNDDDDDDCGDDDEDDKRAPSTDDKAWPEEDKCNFDETLSEAHTLENIDLKVNQGELVGVIGKVGSGKSSLISAILAEMHKVQGHINVMNVEVGFGVTRGEAWLQNATVRDNILFGKPMNSKKYDQIISACALTEDFEALPSGDLTEVGERGVTLSGGQKARLTLARAVYQDKDIYLLDDPLSAVDAHVAKHLYENCIMGCLKRKTRVLCTHHTQYLQQADKIIVMANGKIVQSGSPDVVLSGMDSIMTSYQLDEVSRASPTASFSGSGDAESHSEKHPSGAEGGLVQEEEKDSGIVKLHVYQAFWNAVGRCLAPLVLLSLFLMQASRNISDWWLSYWVTQDSKNSSHFHPNNLTMRLEHNASDVKFYLTVYGSIAGANTVFVLARSFLFAYGGVCAATKVHIDLLGSVLKAPIWFFDKTPLGRIMNRFSTDVYCIDDSLPFMLNILLAQLYGLAGTLVICCYGLPWFALLLVPLGILYYFIQRHYRETSREIKRITSVTLSPIYAHFAETVDGLAIIQASRETSRFANENCEKLEENQKSQYANNAVSQWLAVRLQMIGVAMVTGVAFIAVLEHHFQSVNPGLVGLALSYALSVTGLLSGVVTYFTETEKQMVSMERARQYIDTMPAERQWSILNAPPYWPIQGAVAFNHVCLRYRDGLPLALDNVTFETQPAEKIGIVGRTGSGKSSLFCTLFCMAGLESGTIMIDGINIGHLPLQELRSRLSIIPQDPFLFTGSVGENLDPSLTYTAREMWDVLKKCHLAEAVRRLGGLEAEVGEKGRLFSAGERQLLCLARSMLTSAKVLCIDEATASVDHHTDSLLQQSIRTEFRDHTVFTIAHRMQTVLDSDRVIVMNQGKIVEFDTPSKLLQSKKSLFYRLVHGEGKE